MKNDREERRAFLVSSLKVGVGLVVGGIGALGSNRAHAAIINVAGWPGATFEKKTFRAAMVSALGTDHVPVSRKVRVSAPTIAENGGAVPVSVTVDWPMTESDYIESVYLFVEHNPLPLTSEYHFTPANGVAYVAERIKMAKTDYIHVVARTNAGKLMAAVPRKVKVTIGGCGG